ncbi:hypothetical protein [Halopelagius longus]|uniref:Uncharacterized protein n=2 Tax=Halopelagius longus TaxID=1236180 RepID=A0A1H0XP21_9EURY|nr:hypothetical protein [Halopelagius longus]RDI71978.1 hypothetical protein DWB78_09730 [Halopelagius longus]SDQ04583.1 hypothetical protein SAMN05216278_0048 [Halopelagius longus]
MSLQELPMDTAFAILAAADQRKAYKSGEDLVVGLGNRVERGEEYLVLEPEERDQLNGATSLKDREVATLYRMG